MASSIPLQFEGLWRSFATAAAVVALGACGGPTGGSSGVLVSMGDAGADSQLAGDTAQLDGSAVSDVQPGDSAVSDAAVEDAPGGTDAAAGEVGPPDVLEPVDTPVMDDVQQPPDVPIAVDVPLGTDTIATDTIATDTGKAPCKSDVACKATAQVCDLTSGLCVDCNTKSDCTGAQVCVGNKCVIQTTCTSSKDCPLVCNKASGLCVECVADVDCAANQFCGGDFACHADVCSAGTGTCANNQFFACAANGSGFASVGKACSNGTACGSGTCSAQGCAFPSGTACNDGLACTTGDACKDGVCQGGTSASCNDNNPCTTDSCLDPSGCAHTPISCDDGDACTTDSCDKTSGCVHTPISNCGAVTCGQNANATCNNKCGQAGSNGGCSCTSDCTTAGNCCADFDACGCSSTTVTCGADPTNTCQGKCTTDTFCSFGAMCSQLPGICPPDAAVCCP